MSVEDFTEPADVPCASCGAPVHWLAIFPGGICLACHARAVEGESPEETRRKIVDGFGG
jgi:hypothetical protein